MSQYAFFVFNNFFVAFFVSNQKKGDVETPAAPEVVI